MLFEIFVPLRQRTLVFQILSKYIFIKRFRQRKYGPDALDVGISRNLVLYLANMSQKYMMCESSLSWSNSVHCIMRARLRHAGQLAQKEL